MKREGRMVRGEIVVWSKKSEKKVEKKSEIKVGKKGLKGDGKKIKRNRTKKGIVNHKNENTERK